MARFTQPTTFSINDLVIDEVSYVVGGGATETQPQFNGDPLFEGSYVKIGPLVYFRVNVSMSNITNFGSGQYYVTLPFNSKYECYLREGHLHDYSSGREYSVSGNVAAGSNQLMLFYTISNGQESDFSQGNPITLTTQDDFHIAGSYVKED